MAGLIRLAGFRRPSSWAAGLAAASLLIGTAVHAADRTVHMQVPPPVAEDLAAMPLIAGPVDDAEQRINTAVQRFDASARKAAAACKLDGGKLGDWSRSVEVTMRGPGFLSYVMTDNIYCGGAHPSVGTGAIVYDLRTGRPVDWPRLLPPSLTGTVALAPSMDGTKLVTLSSKRLFALYVAGYRHGGSSEDEAECKSAVSDTGGDEPPAMTVWPDAKAGGLAVQFDLAHAVQACADPVVIPLATLRAEGAQAVLLDAITAAKISPVP